MFYRYYMFRYLNLYLYNSHKQVKSLNFKRC